MHEMADAGAWCPSSSALRDVPKAGRSARLMASPRASASSHRAHFLGLKPC